MEPEIVNAGVLGLLGLSGCCRREKTDTSVNELWYRYRVRVLHQICVPQSILVFRSRAEAMDGTSASRYADRHEVPHIGPG